MTKFPLKKNFEDINDYYRVLGQYFYEHFLTKGLANKKNIIPDRVNQKQYKKGIEVEKEHTDCPVIAARIALDHLAEIPDYYDRLEKMEKEAGVEHLHEADEETQAKPVSKWNPNMILLAYDNPKASLIVAKRFIQNNKLTEVLKIKNFDRNFIYAYNIFKQYSFIARRIDMPVVEPEDARDLQWRLKKGLLDVNPPWSPETNSKNPFPTGLSGEEAKKFLTRGLRFPDSHDKIDVHIDSISLNKLKPVQKLIHVDKTLLEIQKFGIADAINFIGHKGAFITSSDGYILDGHHRFFKGLLINPALKARCLLIHLPMQKLYKLLLAYGDAVGHVRKESLTEQIQNQRKGRGAGRGMGMNRTNPNAPTMAYYTVYGEWPNPPIMGRETQHPIKTINGISIDRNIPSKAIAMLMNNKNIETTASCQGEDERHLTFLIFRPKNQDEKYVKNLCQKLKHANFKCYYDKGREGKFRICVSDKLWYSKNNASEFYKWWFKLTAVIYKITK